MAAEISAELWLLLLNKLGNPGDGNFTAACPWIGLVDILMGDCFYYSDGSGFKLPSIPDGSAATH